MESSKKREGPSPITPSFRSPLSLQRHCRVVVVVACVFTSLYCVTFGDERGVEEPAPIREWESRTLSESPRIPRHCSLQRTVGNHSAQWEWSSRLSHLVGELRRAEPMGLSFTLSFFSFVLFVSAECHAAASEEGLVSSICCASSYFLIMRSSSPLVAAADRLCHRVRLRREVGVGVGRSIRRNGASGS